MLSPLISTRENSRTEINVKTKIPPNLTDSAGHMFIQNLFRALIKRYAIYITYNAHGLFVYPKLFTLWTVPAWARQILFLLAHSSFHPLFDCLFVCRIVFARCFLQCVRGFHAVRVVCVKPFCSHNSNYSFSLFEGVSFAACSAVCGTSCFILSRYVYPIPGNTALGISARSDLVIIMLP